MFARPASSPPSGEAARKPLIASLIAADVRLNGELVSEGEVHLDGALQGEARVRRLVVGETGFVDGAIDADSVAVRGRVHGAITARAVVLHASAQVDGDITASELAIEAGARFSGRSVHSEPPTAVALLDAAE